MFARKKAKIIQIYLSDLTKNMEYLKPFAIMEVFLPLDGFLRITYR